MAKIEGLSLNLSTSASSDNACKTYCISAVCDFRRLSLGQSNPVLLELSLIRKGCLAPKLGGEI